MSASDCFKVIREACGEEDSIEDAFDEYITISLEEAKSTRYHAPRRSYHKSNQICWFKEHLDDDKTGDHLPWLNEDEFLQNYQMSHDSFHKVVKLIENHPIFHKRLNSTKKKKGRKQ